MSKISVYISIFIAVIAILIYADKFFTLTSKESAGAFQFEIPTIKPIKFKTPTKNYSADPSIWGVSLSGQDLSSQSLMQASVNKKTKSSISYIYKTIDGTPAVCIKNRARYCYEFFGTLYKNKKLYGIFYNSSTKSIKELSDNETLDMDLTISSVLPDEVTLSYKKKQFTLKIFRVEKEQKTGKKNEK